MKRTLLAVLCFMLMACSACFAETVYLGSPEDLDTSTIEVQTTNDKDYNHYVNKRYGFAIDVPAAVTLAQETSTNDGCTFMDTADDSTFVIYGAENLMKMSLNELFNVDMVSNMNPTPTYKQFGSNWYAVAWEKGKKTYYKKVVVFGQYYNSFAVTYPTAKQDKYMAIIRHMNGTFAPAFK